jgi:hypothetical protein
MKLKIAQFIAEHPNWEEILSGSPYFITVSRDVWNGRNLILLKYSQFDSDFHSEMVRECRGLILDGDTFEPVSVPYFKFGNYGESYCPEIDWKNCFVEEKIDGSLVKIVKLDGKLLVSTNGTIDAFKAQIVNVPGLQYKSYGDLVVKAVENAGLTMGELYNRLEENKTYMFELTSPYTRIVVKFEDIGLWFHGVRDNVSLKEDFFFDNPLSSVFGTPKLYGLGTMRECVEASEHLGMDAEGFVVCDGNFNRVKVKSPTYVMLHHMSGNHVMSASRGLEIVLKNETEEVLTYFPEFSDALRKIESDLTEFVESLDSIWERVSKTVSSIETRKGKASVILKEFKENSGIGFAFLDGRIASAREYVRRIPMKSLLKTLGYKE